MVFQNTPIGTSWHSDIFLFWVLKYSKFYRSGPPNPENLFEIPESYNPHKFTIEIENL